MKKFHLLSKSVRWVSICLLTLELIFVGHTLYNFVRGHNEAQNRIATCDETTLSFQFDTCAELETSWAYPLALFERGIIIWSVLLVIGLAALTTFVLEWEIGYRLALAFSTLPLINTIWDLWQSSPVLFANYDFAWLSKFAMIIIVIIVIPLEVIFIFFIWNSKMRTPTSSHQKLKG